MAMLVGVLVGSVCIPVGLQKNKGAWWDWDWDDQRLSEG